MGTKAELYLGAHLQFKTPEVSHRSMTNKFYIAIFAALHRVYLTEHA